MSFTSSSKSLKAFCFPYVLIRALSRAFNKSFCFIEVLLSLLRKLEKERNIMKKVLFIFIFIFSCISVYAATAPKWSEFCPDGFENPVILSLEEIENKAEKLAEQKTKVFYCKSDKTYAKILRGVTILPALDCWCGNKLAKSNFRQSLFYENEINSYWLNRKKQFENELSSCNGLSEDAKGMCYLKVREIEHKKNNDLKNEAALRGIQRQLFVQNLLTN